LELEASEQATHPGNPGEGEAGESDSEAAREWSIRTEAIRVDVPSEVADRRPPGVPADQWSRLALEELGCEDWIEVHRFSRGSIDEALRLREDPAREAQEAEAARERADIAVCANVFGDAEWCASHIRALRDLGYVTLAQIMEAQGCRGEDASGAAPSGDGAGPAEAGAAADADEQLAHDDAATLGPARSQGGPGNGGGTSSSAFPSAEVGYREADADGAPLTDEERPARARQVLEEVGRAMASERPDGVAADEWYRTVLRELGCADWYEVLLDPRTRRGEWDHVWEAVKTAKVSAAAPAAT